jgi:hypothetical protein
MTKKSKIVSLVLITASLASCHKSQDDEDWGGSKKVYIRSDTSASYSHHSSGAWLWFYAFRPYGMYRNGIYSRGGYYSGGIGHNANVGSNFAKGRATRGGFGRSGFSSSRS